jgi:hypothetical protein
MSPRSRRKPPAPPPPLPPPVPSESAVVDLLSFMGRAEDLVATLFLHWPFEDVDRFSQALIRQCIFHRIDLPRSAGGWADINEEELTRTY